MINIICSIFIIMGFFLIGYDFYLYSQIQKSPKVQATAKQSFPIVIHTGKYFENHAYIKKKNINLNQTVYKTLYNYVDSLGEEKQFYDEELSDTPVIEGTQKEFHYIESQNKYFVQNKFGKHITSGVLYLLGSIITILLNYYL